MSSSSVNIPHQARALSTRVLSLRLTKLIGGRVTAPNAKFPERTFFTLTTAPQIHASGLNRAFCGNISWQTYTESWPRASDHCDLLSIVSPFCIKPGLSKCGTRKAPPDDRSQVRSGSDAMSLLLADENSHPSVDIPDFRVQDQGPLQSTPKSLRTVPKIAQRQKLPPRNPLCSRNSGRHPRKSKLSTKCQQSASTEQINVKRKESRLETMFQSLVNEREVEGSSERPLEAERLERLETRLAYLVGYVIKNPEHTRRLGEIICELHEKKLVDDEMIARVFSAHLTRAEKTMKEVPVYYDYVISIVSHLLDEAKSVTQIRINDECTSF